MCEGGKMAWPGTEAMERPRPQWNRRQNGQEGPDVILWTLEPQEVSGQGGDTTLTQRAIWSIPESKNLGVGCLSDLLS